MDRNKPTVICGVWGYTEKRDTTRIKVKLKKYNACLSVFFGVANLEGIPLQRIYMYIYSSIDAHFKRHDKVLWNEKKIYFLKQKPYSILQRLFRIQILSVVIWRRKCVPRSSVSIMKSSEKSQRVSFVIVFLYCRVYYLVFGASRKFRWNPNPSSSHNVVGIYIWSYILKLQ